MQYPDSQCAQPTSIGLSKQQTSVRITHLFTEYLNNHGTDDMLLGRSLSMAAALSRFLVLKAMACSLELTPALYYKWTKDLNSLEEVIYQKQHLDCKKDALSFDMAQLTAITSLNMLPEYSEQRKGNQYFTTKDFYIRVMAPLHQFVISMIDNNNLWIAPKEPLPSTSTWMTASRIRNKTINKGVEDQETSFDTNELSNVDMANDALDTYLSVAPPLMIIEALQKHLNDDKGDVESCSYFISALLRPLVFLRNERSIPLTKDKLRLYSALESVELLAYGDAYSSPEDKSANGFIPPLQRWLLTLPDYAHERRFNQLSTTREAFQQRVRHFLFALDQFQLEFTTNNLPEALEEAELGHNH